MRLGKLLLAIIAWLCCLFALFGALIEDYAVMYLFILGAVMSLGSLLFVSRKT